MSDAETVSPSTRAVSRPTLPSTASAPAAMAGAGPVVVGCDGSPAGSPAVAFAVREALLRGVALRAVAAYDVPLVAYGLALPEPVLVELPDHLRASMAAAVRAQVEQVRSQLGGTLELEVRVELGRPSSVLLNASEGAALVVVGARGMNAFARLVLGSTSTELIHHSQVPVVVVPTPEVTGDLTADRTGPEPG